MRSSQMTAMQSLMKALKFLVSSGKNFTSKFELRVLVILTEGNKLFSTENSYINGEIILITKGC